MQSALDFDRVLLAMLSEDRKELRARFCAGNDGPDLRQRFTLKLDKPHLFTRLLERQQGICMGQTNQKKIWPMVPDSLKTLISSHYFCAVSLSSATIQWACSSPTVSTRTAISMRNATSVSNACAPKPDTPWRRVVVDKMMTGYLPTVTVRFPPRVPVWQDKDLNHSPNSTETGLSAGVVPSLTNVLSHLVLVLESNALDALVHSIETEVPRL